MSAALRSVKGTRDLLPPETAVWQAVEETARRVFGLYGYGEIRTPILESRDLFARGVGETTDIVAKEMYQFRDRKGRELCLRPESTAAVARAFAEHGLANQGLPARLFYFGPHFRYERPQKGRYRQFHQIGAELIGEGGPLGDAELVAMLVRFLEALGFADLEVLVNSVGDGPSREAFREALVAHLEPRSDALSPDSRRRLEENPLRILDSKEPRDRQALADAPSMLDHLSEASARRFAEVRDALERLGVGHAVTPRLVRGLDYYTDTVFEIVSAGLGAQDAIVGGGRYDRLLAELGGPDLPAIGFAIGQDRLIDVLPESFRRGLGGAPPALVVAIEPVPALAALELAEELRRAGVAALAETGSRSLGKALRWADRRGLRAAVLLGEAELAAGRAALKDLSSGEQAALPRADLAARLGELQ